MRGRKGLRKRGRGGGGGEDGKEKRVKEEHIQCFKCFLRDHCQDQPSYFPGCELNVKGETECRRIHCISRDLTTLQRIFGRLAGHFIGETHFHSRFDDGLSVVKRCVCGILFCLA